MAENLDTVNQYLRDNFGIDTDDAEPMYRVVWGPEQLEKRLMTSTDSGVQLLHPEVREVPKYWYLPDAFILENRVVVPDVNLKDLPATKKSYEPLWVFTDHHGNPVRPTVLGCKFIIDCVRAAMGKQSLAKYKDPNIGDTPEETKALHQARLKELENQLFGSESGLKGDTINASGSTIIIPGNDTVN